MANCRYCGADGSGKNRLLLLVAGDPGIESKWACALCTVGAAISLEFSGCPACAEAAQPLKAMLDRVESWSVGDPPVALEIKPNTVPHRAGCPQAPEAM